MKQALKIGDRVIYTGISTLWDNRTYEISFIDHACKEVWFKDCETPSQNLYFYFFSDLCKNQEKTWKKVV